MKTYWLLTIFIAISYSIEVTIFSGFRDRIVEPRSDRIALEQMQSISQHQHQSKLQILLPLYIYPNWYDRKNYVWQQVTAAAKKVPISAIINPNNGPNNAPPNSDYQQGIQDLHQAGVKTIGYVSSNYAKRDIQAVKADIDLYIDLFNIDGIFIDEAASTPDKIDYYQQIYRYIKSRSRSRHSDRQQDFNVIINPGVVVAEGYLKQIAADTIVVFENDRQAWDKYYPPGYARKYSSQHFAALIHTTADRNLMKSTIDRVAKYRFGYVYITSGSLTNPNHNPWGSLPEYWQAEVNYLQQLNERESSSIDELKDESNHQALWHQ